MLLSFPFTFMAGSNLHTDLQTQQMVWKFGPKPCEQLLFLLWSKLNALIWQEFRNPNKSADPTRFQHVSHCEEANGPFCFHGPAPTLKAKRVSKLPKGKLQSELSFTHANPLLLEQHLTFCPGTGSTHRYHPLLAPPLFRLYPEPFNCREGSGPTYAQSGQSCHSWQGSVGWSWPYLQRLFWFFFSIWRAMLGSNIYLNIRANTQRFVRTLYEYWILKNFKCTMKLEKFSCMLRGVAAMEGKVITRSDRNYKSWKIVVWPTNILPLMSIKFYSAGSAWKLRSKCVSCSPALMVSAWGGKKNSKTDDERLKSKLRCFFLLKIMQIQKELTTVEAKENFSWGQTPKLLCLSLASTGNPKLSGRLHWPSCGLYPTLMGEGREDVGW